MDKTELASRGRREELFARYVVPEIPVMFRVARSLTAQPADAEDLVQDALVRAYRAIERFDGRLPRAWLLTIVRNTHISRNRRREPELLRSPDAQLDSVAVAPTFDSAETVVLGETFDVAVEGALTALPDWYRTVVKLVDVEGLSYAETARALGIPEGTVMSRLHRARDRIRHDLAAAGLVPKRGAL